MSTALLWFRRDLRLGDHPALVDAIAAADEVVGVFCLDDTLRRPAGAARLAYLSQCLRALDDSMGGSLVVLDGDPVEEIPALADDVDAAAVHVTADFGPYGRRRDEAVAAALSDAGIEFIPSGSPYAVDPGQVFTKAGSHYKVFTPYAKQWRAHGWDPPLERPRSIRWRRVTGAERARTVPIPAPPDHGGGPLPEAGESAAWARLDRFVGGGIEGYAHQRDRPDLDATSRLSADLKWGTIHTRQILDRLEPSRGGVGSGGETTFAAELCWRDFYADVLFHVPESAHHVLNERMRSMTWDRGPDADERFAMWAAGRTGYPIVDAGMRQLQTEKWMHNRVRMIVASFLVKDLHIDWQRGARHFMTHLIDGDLASNQHGWQWTAGTGTDAAPYFRIFNPTSQGDKFDPSGDYVRRHVPELAAVDGGAVHRPWALPGGIPAGYPAPIVDHGEERQESLRRYGATG